MATSGTKPLAVSGDTSDVHWHGRTGIIDNAHSPHYGEVVVVVGQDGRRVTVVPEEPAGFSFAQAELDRRDVRLI